MLLQPMSPQPLLPQLPAAPFQQPGNQSSILATQRTFSGPEPGSLHKQQQLDNLATTLQLNSTQGHASPMRNPSFTSRTATTPKAGSLCSTTQLNEADNIKVAVRVRPLFPNEQSKGGVSVLQVADQTTLKGGHTTLQMQAMAATNACNQRDINCLPVAITDLAFARMQAKVVVPGSANTTMQRDFQFHACLQPDVSQADVMQLCNIPQLLDAALSGYNVTIFAYGQTGSGKTYTMSGREDVIGTDSYQGGDTHDGIISRSVGYLYNSIASKKDIKYSLSASYLEIYNEGVYDLLNLKAKNLPVKWDAGQGFYVPGLKSMTCKTIDGMMDVVRTGMKNRHVGSHELNMESSRSHSMMTISIHNTPLGTGQSSSTDGSTTRFGKICFVDLAGSERLKDSKSEGVMLKETTNINKSLFVLGKVISALADRETNGTTAHIPYRDSKLTKLLMDSLGGSSLALMIACCSPSSVHLEDTLSTLSYATRAKNIQNRPTIQYDPKEAQIVSLRREIELLRQENAYLREQLHLGGHSLPGTPPVLSTPSIMKPPHSPLAFLPPPPAVGATVLDAPGSIPLPLSPSLSMTANVQGVDTDTAAPLMPSHNPGFTMRHLTPSASSSPMRIMSPRLNALLQDHKPPTSPSSSVYSSLASSQNSSLKDVPLENTKGADSPTSHNSRSESPIAVLADKHRRMTLTDADLFKRMQDTHALLLRFSEENSRLARENDKLRVHRQVLSNDHAEVLDEIDLLRSKLSLLETTVLSGPPSPVNLKTMRSAGPHSGSGTTTPNGMAPNSPGTRAVQHQYLDTASQGLSGSAASSSNSSHVIALPYSGVPLATAALNHSGSINNLSGSLPPSRGPQSLGADSPNSSQPPSSHGTQHLSSFPSLSSGFGASGSYADLHKQRTDSYEAAALPGCQPAATDFNLQPHPPSVGGPSSSHGHTPLPHSRQQHGTSRLGFTADRDSTGGNSRDVANVLAVGGTPGSNDLRTRGMSKSSGYGQSPKGKADEDSAIIVTDKSKLSLLLGP